MASDEALETGYGPGTPRGDNACNDFVQGSAKAYLSLAQARGGRVVEDGALVLADTASESFFCNLAVARAPMDEGGWRAAVADMEAFFGEHEGGDFLVFSTWPTPDLAELGFELVGHPPLMLRPPAVVTPQPVEGLEVRRVDDPASAQDWERALVNGFPLSDLQPFRAGCFLPTDGRAVDRWHHWVGYLEGEPVGTSSAYLDERHVQVEYISTVESARGRGVGRAMTATATALDHSLPTMLMASDLGRPVYERLGYRAILRFTLWIGHRRAADR